MRARCVITALHKQKLDDKVMTGYGYIYMKPVPSLFRLDSTEI